MVNLETKYVLIVGFCTVATSGCLVTNIYYTPIDQKTTNYRKPKKWNESWLYVTIHATRGSFSPPVERSLFVDTIIIMVIFHIVVYTSCHHLLMLVMPIRMIILHSHIIIIYIIIVFVGRKIITSDKVHRIHNISYGLHTVRMS